MKPVKFNEANSNLHKPQTMSDDECQSLPVFTDGEQIISCWKMSFKERLSALIHGKVWLSVLSGQSHPPVCLGCTKTVFVKPKTEYDYKKGPEYVENAKCCHCGKIHTWSAYTCAVYNGQFVCEDCYQDYFGYCNKCDMLHKYADMNDEIICKNCQEKGMVVTDAE